MFLDTNADPAMRYILLAKAAEYVFVSTQEEALKYNEVESVLEDGEQEDIFSPEEDQGNY